MDNMDSLNIVERYGRSGCRFDDSDELSEMSFLPPSDDRVYESGIYDIADGEGFAEYADWFWDEYGYEIYDDDLSLSFS